MRALGNLAERLVTLYAEWRWITASGSGPRGLSETDRRPATPREVALFEEGRGLIKRKRLYGFGTGFLFFPSLGTADIRETSSKQQTCMREVEADLILGLTPPCFECRTHPSSYYTTLVYKEEIQIRVKPSTVHCF